METSLYFLLCIGGVLLIPIDDPIRIDLPVYDQPRASSNVVIAEPLERENHPSSSKVDKSASGNLTPSRSYDINSVYSDNINPKYPEVGSVNTGGGFFSNPVTKIEGAFLETEGYGSKVLSVKENAQNVVAGIFQACRGVLVQACTNTPQTIVNASFGFDFLFAPPFNFRHSTYNDSRFTEEEKYGNNGDKFHNAGRAIVGGAEGISNFFNSILEIPSSIIRSITRTATEKLNNLGGRLIGL